MEQQGLRFGFLGVGQCGGNVANEFSKIGYKAIAINTSSTDLMKLEHISKNNRLLIPLGIQGAGKNPEVGKQALTEHIETVMNLINNVFVDEVDMLFVCAGLGGGTGSGIAPLLTQILAEQGYSVGMIVTIPSEIESPKVKIVALNAFEEISQIENMGALFVVDNAKAGFLPSQMGFKTKYSIVNENIARKLDLINKITTQPSEVAFDARDFQTLLLSRGAAMIATLPIEDVADISEPESVALMGRRGLETSIYADSAFDQVKGAAFLFELPEGSGGNVTEDAIRKAQRELGTPFETFTGIYESKGKRSDGKFTLLVTGLPFPIERLTSIQEELSSQADAIQRRLETVQTQQFSGNAKALLNRFVSPQTTAKPAEKVNGESTLDKLLRMKKG
jgi:tubulin-like protein CetZ